jgi:hypothetical protein
VSIGGGVLAAWTHAATIGPDEALKSLVRPAIFPLPSVCGLAAGTIIYPLVMWAVNDKNLRVAVPVSYGFSVLVVIGLNLLHIRFSVYISVVLTAFLLLLYRFVGK